MRTLEELHKAYMESRKDDFDNYNIDDDHEAELLNDYYNTSDDDITEVHWEPVSKIPDGDKLLAMKKFYAGFRTESGMKYLKKSFGMDVHQIPFVPDPFSLSSEIMDDLWEISENL